MDETTDREWVHVGDPRTRAQKDADTKKSIYQANLDHIAERNPGLKNALQREPKFIADATASWPSIVRKATGCSES